MRRIPRVSYGWPGLIRGGASMSKLEATKLAQENAAGFFEPTHGRRVRGGNMIDENPRVSRGPYAGSFNQILQPERYAVQRAPVPSGLNFRLGCLGLAQRLFLCDQHEAVKLGVDFFDAIQESARQVQRGQLLGS